MTSTRPVPLVKMAQLHTQHGSLQTFHSIIVANSVVMVFAALPVIAQLFDDLHIFAVISYHRSAFPVCAQVLPWIKTETGELAHAAGALSFVFSPVRLRSIFDHYEVMASRDFQDGIHVRASSIQMNRHDCFCAGSDGFFHQRRIHSADLRIDVDQYGSCSRVENGCHTGDERIAYGDNLVA